MDINKAIQLIKDFAVIETELCKEANYRRGITKRSLKIETKCAENLLAAIYPDYSKADLFVLLKTLNQ